MFSYCGEALGLSEHEAYHRIEAGRAARQFPAILELLTEGALNLTTVRLLARHLTAANHTEVLASARGLSRRQVEQLSLAWHRHPMSNTAFEGYPHAAPRAQGALRYVN